MFKWILCAVAILLNSLGFANNKTLVIILGETRAHELTYENIKKNLIDTVGADLALCIGVGENYNYDNPFYQNAKYKFIYDEPPDYSTAFDYAYEIILNENPPSRRNRLHWREFLKIKDQYLGGIKDPYEQHPGSAGILIFCRWFLLKNLIDNDLLDKYDFFIITRSDYLYKLPHPKIELLSKDSIYIPDGEHYLGVTDRHVVLPQKFVEPYLNLLNKMVSKGKEYYKHMKLHEPLNLEKFIKFHLIKQKVFQFVNFFPYVMYTVRPIDGTTRWAAGIFSEEHGYFIKYPSEFILSEQHKADFEREGCNSDEFYKQRILAYPKNL